MKTAREHPDTADVVFPDVLALAATVAVALTIGAPLLLGLFR